MKRALALVVLLGAPLAMALFPRLRRSLVRKARLVLLLYAGAVLVTAFAVGFRSNRAAGLSGGEIALGGAGVALVLFAFAAVVRDALRDRSTRG
jgi:hypothetical protein